MDTRTERKTQLGISLLAALMLSAAGCALLVAGCIAPQAKRPSRASRALRPNVELLLGIHRAASQLLGDSALQTVLDLVRLRVNDPIILKRQARSRTVLMPASRETQVQMRDILERAFADRILVLPRGSSNDHEPATVALESTFSELDSGIEIKLRLVSIADGSVFGTTRVVATGANDSFLTRAQPRSDSDQKPAQDLPSVGLAPLPKTELAEGAPTASGEGAPAQVDDRGPARAAPSGSLANPAPAGQVPDWINEVLSHYPGPTGPDS